MSHTQLEPLKTQNQMTRHARPCTALHPVVSSRLNDKDLPGALLSELSFIGGKPRLPQDFVWPTGSYAKDGQAQEVQVPLIFSAQFDLSELARLGMLPDEMPDHGILAFFSPGHCTGFFNDPTSQYRFGRVCYFEQTNNLMEHERPDVAPELLDEYDCKDLTLPYLRIAARLEWSFPVGNIYADCDDTDTAALKEIGFNIEELQDLYSNEERYAEELAETDHIDIFADAFTSRSQLGGHTFFIQEELIQRADDRVLFTLGSFYDKDSERWLLCFGDAGNIYYTIKSQDLKDRRFDQANCDFQCY